MFVTFVGDHAPRHVHVFRNERLVVKWDLEHGAAMEGAVSRKILDLIAELQRQGRL